MGLTQGHTGKAVGVEGTDVAMAVVREGEQTGERRTAVIARRLCVLRDDVGVSLERRKLLAAGDAELRTRN